MASTHQILCIKKSEKSKAHERITHIGGVNKDSTKWNISHSEAIAGMEKGDYSFYIYKGGARVRVVIATSLGGSKYIKTENDGLHPDDLLSLPECP